MIKFYRQQTIRFIHHNRLMIKKFFYFIILAILFLSSCKPGTDKATPILLAVENASKDQLINEINRFAKVNSMSAKMDLKFEDTSFANQGKKKSYVTATLTSVVQRPANIYLKVEFFSVDIAQMTSNGDKFRVAVLKDNSGGKFKKFVLGSNNADYAKLESGLKKDTSDDSQSVSSVSRLRPQHFTDAILIRPTDSQNTYLQSTIYQIEEDEVQKKKVMRGYYLLDEYSKDSNGDLKISRRFWFDRVVSIRLARQQLFDNKGEIESDIVYGQEGNLANGEYKNLPLRIMVTRPKEKYSISLTYQSPESVKIGNNYKPDVFELKNTWGLDEVDLDKKLQEVLKQNSAITNQ